MKNYNDRLRELREDNDLKQKDIAKLLGINQQVYSRYELGIRSLPIELLIKLCEFYKVSSDSVLGLNPAGASKNHKKKSNKDILCAIIEQCSDTEVKLITQLIKTYKNFNDKK